MRLGSLDGTTLVILDIVSLGDTVGTKDGYLLGFGDGMLDGDLDEFSDWL